MNYLKEIIAFHHWLETNPLDATEQALWFHLMDINNRCGWLEWFQVANLSLQARLGGIDRKTLDRKRNTLKQAGRIDYINQGKREAGKYRMVPFTGKIPLEESFTGNIPLETGKSVPNNDLNLTTLIKQKETKPKKDISEIDQILNDLITLYKQTSPLSIKKFGKGGVIKARDTFEAAIELDNLSPYKLAEAIENNPELPPWDIVKRVEAEPEPRQLTDDEIAMQKLIERMEADGRFDDTTAGPGG